MHTWVSGGEKTCVPISVPMSLRPASGRGCRASAFRAASAEQVGVFAAWVVYVEVLEDTVKPCRRTAL